MIDYSECTPNMPQSWYRIRFAGGHEVTLQGVTENSVKLTAKLWHESQYGYHGQISSIKELEN